jgi:hypothetical protein
MRGARSKLQESARQLRGIALVQVPNAKIRYGVGGMFSHRALSFSPTSRAPQVVILPSDLSLSCRANAALDPA